MLRTVTNLFGNAVDLYIYCLVGTPVKYNVPFAKSVAKWAKRLLAQMKTNVSDSFNPILIIGLSSTLKLACDTNGIHKSAASHMTTSLYHENPPRRRSKFRNSAFVKAVQIQQGGDAIHLPPSDQIPFANFRHKRCYRRMGLQNSTIHTAVKRDVEKVGRASMEQGTLLQCYLRWIRPETNNYERTTRSNPA